MSTACHHAEWLSLVEASGPFVSLPVLLQAFPQGLEAHDPDSMRRLKLAHEEWDDNQQGTRPDPAIHRAWVEFVLTETLELPEKVLLSSQGIPSGLQVTIAEQGETLRPDWVVVNADEGHKPRLLVQVYPASQSLEKSVKGSRWAASPATRMMELLHACDVRLGLITNGDHWMLVNAPKGETTGYISWYATLWQEENVTLRAFRSLLGVQRFFNVPDEETLEALLAQSVNSQQEVTDQLGYQVLRAVEVLVRSMDRIEDRNRALLQEVPETRLYEAALTVMMRLVFLFFAEENQLIPPQETEFYDTFYAVTTLRGQLREQVAQNGEEILECKHDAWCRLLATFRAVHGGVHHDALYIPAYGGSLFNPDRFPFLEGRKEGTYWLEIAANPILVNNRTVLHLLEALQVLQVRGAGGGVESRKLSFRALDIEQIGHVYEGLLDHTAVRATEPILGLEGSKKNNNKNKEPKVSLTALERHWQKGEAALVEFLAKETGKSPSFLKKRIPSPHPLTPSPQDEGSGQGKKLRSACNNDQALFHRVLPWVGLICLDTFDYPTVIPAGSVFVTQGSDRRETGTHYTPKTLTEEIVKYTLEPLVYAGVAEGKPKEEWRLKSAPDLLALKVCDMAMGSGAFLVQVCRYLSERLVEAWEEEMVGWEDGEIAGTPPPHHPATPPSSQKLRILPDGSLSTAEPGESILPNDPDERLAVARRIVADRCLYGVDKNPMAVEMAKLSLWLITLQKNRPFTFLDHALRCGDSLLGVTQREQIEFLHLNPDNEAVQLRTVSEIWRPLLAQAIAKRQELESFTVNDIQDLARKEALQAEAEALTSNIKIAADYLIGEALAHAGKTGNLKGEDLGVLSGLVTDALEEADERERENKLRQIREKAQRMLNAGKPEGQPPREPFHWALEFPEVFLEENAPKGFSAIVGNPPFLGNKYWASTVGSDFHKYAVKFLSHCNGRIDLCSVFFNRSYSLTYISSNVGLIGCESLKEGDSRKAALDHLATRESIFRANSSLRWPGSATVRICIVWFVKGKTLAEKVLDGVRVKYIDGYLNNNSSKNPYKLVGSIWAGQGTDNTRGDSLTLSTDDEYLTILLDSQSPFCHQYVTADDITSHGFLKCQRWIVDVQDLSLEEVRAIHPETFLFLENVVKPVRNEDFLSSYPSLYKRWWQVWRPRSELYKRVREYNVCMVVPVVSKYVLAALAPSNWVFTNKFFAIPYDRPDLMMIINSNFGEAWIRAFSGKLGETMSVSISDAVQTFPLPISKCAQTDLFVPKFNELLKRVMSSRRYGYTDLYNDLHDPTCTDPDIQTLRHLHIQMDTAVAAAYGWHDLPLNHDFHDTKQGLRFTISEAARREVLDRLLALNHHRYAEEVAQGLHDKKKAKGKSKKAKSKPASVADTSGKYTTQGTLFGDDPATQGELF